MYLALGTGHQNGLDVEKRIYDVSLYHEVSFHVFSFEMTTNCLMGKLGFTVDFLSRIPTSLHDDYYLLAHSM